MNRRELLKTAAAALPLTIAAGRLYAAPLANAPRLLVVFLRGAYDAANIVIPASSDFYYSARPTLAVAKTASLPLNSDWSLHPALKDSILSAVAGKADCVRAVCRHRRHQPKPLRNARHDRAGPAARWFARLSLGFHEPHCAIVFRRPADRVHEPASADVPRWRSDSQSRTQLHRQAGSRGQECGTYPGDVSGPGPCASRRRRLRGAG